LSLCDVDLLAVRAQQRLAQEELSRLFIEATNIALPSTAPLLAEPGTIALSGTATTGLPVPPPPEKVAMLAERIPAVDRVLKTKTFYDSLVASATNGKLRVADSSLPHDYRQQLGSAVSCGSRPEDIGLVMQVAVIVETARPYLVREECRMAVGGNSVPVRLALVAEAPSSRSLSTEQSAPGGVVAITGTSRGVVAYKGEDSGKVAGNSLQKAVALVRGGSSYPVKVMCDEIGTGGVTLIGNSTEYVLESGTLKRPAGIGDRLLHRFPLEKIG
jgi:hypothetical protein